MTVQVGRARELDETPTLRTEQFPLTLRRLASLAGVSPALVCDCVVTPLLLALAAARSMVLRQIGGAVSAISPEPVSVVTFGSFARGEADAHSDIDLAVVRADDVDDDDEGWAKSIDAWRRQVRNLTGNDVEIIEATASEATRKLRGRSELWQNIKRDGIVVYGKALDELAG